MPCTSSYQARYLLASHRMHSTLANPKYGMKPPLSNKRGNIHAVLNEISQIKDINTKEQIDTNPYNLHQHGKDESLHDSAPPDAIFYPKSTEQVASVVKICSRHDTPIIPFGVGTSLEGGISALAGGLCIDLGKYMTKVLDIRTDDMDVRVEAGVTRKQLEKELLRTGLYFPIDPGADATIGGMASTRASGTTAVKYGTMKNMVMGLTVVTPSGDIIKTGGRARKSSAGYDLTSLYCGSEGTLGIITEVQLRLFGRPNFISCATCAFDSLHAAVETVVKSLQLGIPLARAELLDSVTMKAVYKYLRASNSSIPTSGDKAAIFLEFHGISKNFVQEQAEVVRDIANDLGGSGFAWTEEQEKRDEIWKARHSVYYALKGLRGENAHGWATDVCVPVSELAKIIQDTANDAKEAGIVAPICGHIGDGNFHTILLFDPTLDDEIYLNKLMKIYRNLTRRAISVGGTCTGEHGVGFGKMEWMIEEHGSGSINVMKQIKQAIDPKNIMNPGKIIP